ncbi:MAG: helix-turn-helix domain-containing protein [Kordiimonas sp.]
MEDLPLRTISNEALHGLEAYHWPGNIRQLQNALFRAVILSETDMLTPSDFPHLADGSIPQSTTTSVQPPTTNNTHFNGLQERLTSATVELQDSEGHIIKLADMEKAVIAAALKRYDHKMAEVARRLGIGRSTLYRKVTEYKLDN